MSQIQIEKEELCSRIEHYLNCRDMSDGNGGRTLPIKHNIRYMARELTEEISKSDKNYYDYDDFRSRA